MNNNSRTMSSIKSLSSTVVLQVAKQVLEFIVRTVFIKVLVVEYLGVNGLFTNILTCLSLAELGVGGALTYSMYKPMAEGNYAALKTYMRAYKNIYRAIGIFVISIGVLLTFFLDFFVTQDTDIPHLKFIFLLYVLRNSASYFFAYKQSAFSVDQKQYVINNNELFKEIITAISRLIVLITTRNFILYLAVSIICVYIANIRIAFKADKEYPYLKEKDVQPLSKENKDKLLNNVGAIFLHRVSYVVLGSTDNIILSKIFGLVIVGLYSNYLILINLVKTVFDMAASSIVPSVGNYCAVSSKKDMEHLLYTLLFINVWTVTFCCTGLYNLMTPFIIVWIGNEYTMDLFLVSMITLSLYIQLTMRTAEMYHTATGIFVYDKYYSVLQSILNVIISIIAAKLVGPAGIFIGTAIAMLATRFWTAPYYLYKNVFQKSVKIYFWKYCKFTVIGICCFGISTILVNMINSSNIFGFVIKLMICIVVPNLLFALFTAPTNEFKECCNRVMVIIHKKSS